MAKPIHNLSVIIPTINEAKRLPLLIADLKTWPYSIDLNIVDGGSKDLTTLTARLAGANVINCSKKNRGL